MGSLNNSLGRKNIGRSKAENAGQRFASEVIQRSQMVEVECDLRRIKKFTPHTFLMLSEAGARFSELDGSYQGP